MLDRDGTVPDLLYLPVWFQKLFELFLLGVDFDVADEDGAGELLGFLLLGLVDVLRLLLDWLGGWEGVEGWRWGCLGLDDAGGRLGEEGVGCGRGLVSFVEQRLHFIISNGY